MLPASTNFLNNTFLLVLWEFHARHFDHIISPHLQLPLESLSLFHIHIRSYLCYPHSPDCVCTHSVVVLLPVAKPLKKTESLSPWKLSTARSYSTRGRTLYPPPLAMLRWFSLALILHGSCGCSHNWCELTRATTLLYCSCFVGIQHFWALIQNSQP